MKYLLLFIFVFVININAVDIKTLDKELDNLSLSQKEVLVKTWLKAKKFNLEFTMTAIAWHESHFGLYPINLSDPSFGVFHNLITSVARRHNVTSKWSKSRLAEQLIQDYDFSFAESLSELKFWQGVHKNKPNNWSLTVKSYNAGYRHENGKQYLVQIKTKIKALKRFFKRNEFNLDQKGIL